jgi:hypothetical protein
MFEEEEIKTFTLQEAQSLIPMLRKLLELISREREVLADMNAELTRAREKAEFGGGSVMGPAYLRHLTRFSEAVDNVQSLGVLIKDYKAGLIDFPYLYEGRIVYLCWRLGEGEIDWWHETEAGFAGRKLLTSDFK